MKHQIGLSLYLLKKLVFSDRSGSLVRRTARLSFAAIVISVAVFFVVMFVMNGMNQNIRTRILSIDPHLALVQKNQIPEESGRIKNVLPFPNSTQFQGTHLEFDNYDLIMRTVDGQFRGVQVIGYDQEGLNYWKARLETLRKSEGKWSSLSDRDFNLSKNEIAIGIDLARLLGVLEGDEVTLIPAETLLLGQLDSPLFQKVTIKYILTTDLYDLDAKLVLFNLRETLATFKTSLSRVSGYHLWFDQVGKIDQYLKTLKFDPLLKDQFHIESWKEKNSDLFFALFLEKTIIGLFLGLAGLVASSSILTVLSLIMSQKKNDIAILKTLGLSNRATLMLFTLMGIILAGTAIFAGTLLGVGVSLYIENYPLKILPRIYYDSSIPALVDFSLVFAVVIGSLLLSVLGCFLPSQLTLKIQPAILLKTR